MMQVRGTNTAASVRQRLLDQSREKRVDFNLLLTNYGLERFLYRLGRSEFSERFILKGAMLFPLWGAGLPKGNGYSGKVSGNGESWNRK
jgi:hypothetical protein